ncbi:hypothetical protein C8Q74DRAFT_1366941 [Fomes fomentarius]|nr:hypothetical protein C8Q74DRAFT_1366941 [Fomes fomentarius]
MSILQINNACARLGEDALYDDLVKLLYLDAATRVALSVYGLAVLAVRRTTGAPDLAQADSVRSVDEDNRHELLDSGFNFAELEMKVIISVLLLSACSFELTAVTYPTMGDGEKLENAAQGEAFDTKAVTPSPCAIPPLGLSATSDLKSVTASTFIYQVVS